MRRAARVIGGCAAAALVAGCGGGSKQQTPDNPTAARSSTGTAASSAVPVGGPGTYVGTDSGAKLSVAFPAPDEDPLVRKLEAYRKKVGSTPRPTYATIDVVNNRKGSYSITGVTAVTGAGRPVPLEFARDYVGTLQREAEGDATLSKQGVILHNSLRDTDLVRPGAKVHTVLMTTRPVDPLQSLLGPNRISLKKS